MVRISDKTLLELLRENSRLSYTKLAEKFGVTEAAIRKRVKKLIEKEVIKRFTIDIDPKKVGIIIALIGLDAIGERYVQTLNVLKKETRCLKLYTSTGDHMIMAEFWFNDTTEMTKYIKFLESLDGVTRVCPTLLQEQIK